MQEFNSQGVKFCYRDLGAGLPVVIWAHGWGQSHAAFLPLIAPFEGRMRHITLDFPGFGASETPPQDWDTATYADAIAAWIKDQGFPPVLWVGHSFGCRVGVQIAARHPECVRAMTFIAGAGLKRKRPALKRLYLFLRIRLFKILKRLVPEGALKQNIMRAFGSRDYQSAGAMRSIFIRVVNEDLTEQAKMISCPVALIYGSGDTETPPEFGERYSRLITGSKFFLLDGQDHYSVLGDGRHPVIKILNDFIEENA